MKRKIIQSFWIFISTKTVFLNCAVFFLYVFLGKIGLSFAVVNPSATALWAPTGIALASLLIFGFRVAPAIFLGAFVVNLTTAGGIFTSLAIAFGNTFEGVMGAYFLRKFAKGAHAFDRTIDLYTYILFAGILATTISATIGVTTLLAGKLATLSNFSSIWLTWWLGDVGGNMIIAPLILVWANHPRINISPRGLLHFIAAFIGLVVMTQVVFLGIIPYPYLTIPIGVWIAFWFGRRGATAATLLVTLLAIWDTLHGTGPFASTSSLNHNLILLQMFLSIFSLTALTFATTLLEFRKTEHIVASQERRFQALIEKSFDAVVLIDVSSKILYASPSVQRLLGYRPEELVGTTGFDLVDKNDRQRTSQELAKLVLKPGGAVTIEYRTMRKDKKTIWIEATGTNLLLEPSVNAVVVNFRDITEKKLTEARLREEKMEDEAMLGSIGDGIIATNSEGEVTMVNHRACEMLGWDEKDLLHKPVITIIPMETEDGKTLSDAERPITKVLSLGKRIVTSSTIYYVRKDKTKFPIHFTVTPIVLNKQVVGAIEVFQDITQEKEVDKAKTEFVSLASHQLRTPLATINWYLEELMRMTTNATEKEKSYLKEVYAASRRMVDLINALLNTSRLELGTFVVDPQTTDIKELMKQIFKDLSAKIEEKRVILKESYSENFPLIIVDSKLFAIILQNLIANAIKYTRENDTIDLIFSYSEKEFLIQVKDNGYGIPKNQQEKIFSKLFRADNARAAVPEGSGLGLYIVKSIVVASGGKIWFESEENKGTSFFVSFPSSGMQQKQGGKELI